MDQPPGIPQRPMGGVRSWPGSSDPTVRSGGRPRRTGGADTHVLVHWVEDDQAQAHHYGLAWLRAEDVRRFLKT